jgi:hypothetical protein
VITDGRGEYVIANLPVGPYKLEAKLPGLRHLRTTGITLTVGASPVVNVMLKVGAGSGDGYGHSPTRRSSTCAVPASAPPVTEDQMVGLPLNGRQASQLILSLGPAVDNGGSAP